MSEYLHFKWGALYSTVVLTLAVSTQHYCFSTTISCLPSTPIGHPQVFLTTTMMVKGALSKRVARNSVSFL